MKYEYDCVWLAGAGDGLATNLALLLNRRAEQGWRTVAIVAHDRIISGVLATFERER